MTGRWRKVIGRSDQEARQQKASAVAIEHWQQIDRTQTAASDRVQKGSKAVKLRPDAFDQDDLSVRSVAKKQDFILNGYFLSGAYKYNPQLAK